MPQSSQNVALRSRIVPVVAVGVLGLAALAIAGPLTPPVGPVAASYKTLGEVEPRIAISSVNTPGDADSIFKITTPGAYYLTGNITGVSGKHGIEIAASGVTIDLNGFDMYGGAGSLDGVRVTAAGMINMTVRNGSIRGWGSDGIDAWNVSTVGFRVESVQVGVNGESGIAIGSGSAVSNCTAYDNGANGISTGDGSMITACASRDNNTNGIVVGFGGTITGCSSNANGVVGIFTGGASTVQGCTANTNGTHGIDAQNGTVVTSSSARANVLNGIRASFQCTISGNACSSNGSGGDGAGILVTGSGNRIDGNNCGAADRGIDVDAGGNIIVKNTCTGNTVNWSIVAGNSFLVVQAPVTASVFNGNAGGGGYGTTDPNANITY